MSRIRPLSVEEVRARGVEIEPFLQDFGELPNSIRTLAYRPDILAATLGLWAAIMHAGSVPAELKYMAGYLASMSAGCRYCSAHTASKAHASGVSEEKMRAIWEYDRSPLFSPAERAALSFARNAGQSPSAVEDADLIALQAHFTDEQIIELLGVAALYGFFNRWNDSLATKLEEAPRAFAEARLGAHGWEVGKHE